MIKRSNCCPGNAARGAGCSHARVLSLGSTDSGSILRQAAISKADSGRWQMRRDDAQVCQGGIMVIAGKMRYRDALENGAEARSGTNRYLTHNARSRCSGVQR